MMQAPGVLEVASLQVRPGQEAAFEAACAQARALIGAMPGHLGHELQRGIEQPDRSVLQLGWRTLEDHTAGFRQSAAHQEWRALLLRFYDPFPTVLHDRPVAEAPLHA